MLPDFENCCRELENHACIVSASLMYILYCSLNLVYVLFQTLGIVTRIPLVDLNLLLL